MKGYGSVVWVCIISNKLICLLLSNHLLSDVQVLSRAFRNRFVELHFDELPSGELEIILHQRCSLPPSYCTKLVKVMQDLQVTVVVAIPIIYQFLYLVILNFRPPSVITQGIFCVCGETRLHYSQGSVPLGRPLQAGGADRRRSGLAAAFGR